MIWNLIHLKWEIRPQQFIFTYLVFLLIPILLERISMNGKVNIEEGGNIFDGRKLAELRAKFQEFRRQLEADVQVNKKKLHKIFPLVQLPGSNSF